MCTCFSTLNNNYICSYICIYVWVFIECINANTYMNTFVCTFEDLCTYEYTCIHLQIGISTSTYVYVVNFVIMHVHLNVENYVCY